MLIPLKVTLEGDESYWDTDDFKRIQKMPGDANGPVCCVTLKSGGEIFFQKDADLLKDIVNKIRQS